MRTRSFDTLVIILGIGLVTVGQLGCKGDDEGESDSAADAESSGSSTESGSTTATDAESSSSASTTSDTDCIPGELGCTCNGGLCLGDLVCENDICTDPNCIPGELACECNMGLCLGDLVCVDGVCLEDGGTTSETSMGTTTTDTGSTTTDTGMDCPNPNEMLCDGVCVDVVSNPDHCGGCGVVCEVNMAGNVGGCEDSQCLPYWSEACFQQDDGFTTCDQACQAEGKVCVEDGCGGFTWIGGSGTICITGGTNSSTSGVACGGAIVWETGYLRCCCI